MIQEYDSLSEKFIRKGFWLYFFSFILGPVGYIIKIIISEDLTVSEVGILYGIISLITLLMSYNDLGMSESLKHFIPKFVTEKRYDKIKSVVFLSFFVQFISATIIGFFFFFGSDFIANNYFNSIEAAKALKIFSFYFFALSIFQTLETFFISIQDTFTHKIIDTFRLGFTMFYVFFVFFFGFGDLTNFSYGWVISLYLGTCISLILFYKKYYRKYFKNEKIVKDKKLLKEFSKYAILVFIGASASTILSQIDMQLIIYILGTKDAGYYTNYLSIINIPFLVIGPILGFLFPVFSELHSKGQKNKIKFTKEIFSKIFILIGIMFNLFFFLFAQILAYTIFGEKFIESGNILQYSILFLIFNYLLQINFNLMAGTGRVKERVKITLTAIIINIIMNLILIKLIGVVGSALATGLGWLFIWIMSEFKLGKQFIKKENWKPIIINIFAFLSLGIFYYKFIIWNYETYTRIQSFFLLGLAFLFWSIVFILINYNEFKGFIVEFKKIKKPN